MFWVFLNFWWLTVKVNLVLPLKAVKEIARLSNQSSLNQRELSLRNFEDKHLISMEKRKKSEKYTVGLTVRVSNYRSLDLEKRFIFYHAPSFVKKSIFKEIVQTAGKILTNKRNCCLVKIIQDDKQRKDLKVGGQWNIEKKCLKLSPM